MINVNNAIIIRNILDTNTNSVIIVTALHKDSHTTYISGKTLDGTRVLDLDVQAIKGLVESKTAVVLKDYNINILKYLYK